MAAGKNDVDLALDPCAIVATRMFGADAGARQTLARLDDFLARHFA